MALVESSNHTTSTYDREMQDKISSFMSGSEYEIGDDNDDDDSVDERGELNIPDYLEDNTLDHIVIACSDIMEGRKQLEEMTGLKPGIVTTKRGGAGVKSCSIALNDNTFMEMIAPIPGTSEGMSPDLSTIPSGEIVAYHYAIRTNDPDKFEENPPADNWNVDKVTMIGASSPDMYDQDGGVINKWDSVHFYGHGLGGVVPSMVHWRENRAHPTAHLKDQGARLRSVEVSVPSGSNGEVDTLVGSVSNVSLSSGSPELVFELDTPRGSVTFRGHNPTGIVMPGFEDMGHQSYNKAAN